jgi:hypothetical protein
MERCKEPTGIRSLPLLHCDTGSTHQGRGHVSNATVCRCGVLGEGLEERWGGFTLAT